MARIVRTLVMQPQLVAVAHPKCRFRIALFLSRFPLSASLCTSSQSRLMWQTKHAMATRSCAKTCTFYKLVGSFSFSSLALPLSHTHTRSLSSSLSLLLTLVCKNARLLLTFSILCTRMRPLFGLPSFSEDIISSSLSSFMPSARSVNRSSTSILACD